MNGRRLHKLRNRKARGFTLLELLVSMTAATILLAGLASTMKMADWAWDATETLDDQASLKEPLEMMRRELSRALYFTERTSTAVTFAVPGPEGGFDIEVVRYHWSGVSGDPLTVSRDGADEQILIADVDRFDMSFLSRTVTGGATP